VFKQLSLKDIGEEINNLKHISKYCQKHAVCYIDSFQVQYPIQICIVMNYIEGYNLDFKTSKDKSFIDNTVLERNKSDKIIFDLILGLNLLHSLNIAHQDIKLPNIMYDSIENTYKYVDWGGSCLITSCEKDGKCDDPCGYIGTSKYASPEKLKLFTEINKKRGKNITVILPSYFIDNILHDIWSLGLVLLSWYTFNNVYTADYKNTLDLYLKNKKLNKLAQCIIPLLLEENPKKRASNWKSIVKVLKSYKSN